MQIEIKVITIGDPSRAHIGALTKAISGMGKVLICDDKAFVRETTKQHKIEQINFDMFKPIEDFRYNFHDKFREYGISKKEMFKTMKICRKK